jgi:carbonic anhydrase/acetyltransferase-like protein (isoleucine patch superfamily)
MNIERFAALGYERLNLRIRTIHRRLSDLAFEEWSGLRSGEHDVDPSVEFRTRRQIVLGAGTVIKAGTILDGRSSVRSSGVILGEDTYLKERCILDAYGGFIEIGGSVSIGQNVLMHGGGGLRIGHHVIMGANCYLIASNHIFSSNEYPIMLQGDRRKGISIGNNVWLGGNVIVLDGVAIGSSVVIGAGAVISEDIPSGSIVCPQRSLNVAPLRY